MILSFHCTNSLSSTFDTFVSTPSVSHLLHLDSSTSRLEFPKHTESGRAIQPFDIFPNLLKNHLLAVSEGAFSDLGPDAKTIIINAFHVTVLRGNKRIVTRHT
jgi:hypothetical protein